MLLYFVNLFLTDQLQMDSGLFYGNCGLVHVRNTWERSYQNFHLNCLLFVLGDWLPIPNSSAFDPRPGD